MGKKRILRFIDLFAGAGGLAQGFHQASDEEVEFRSVFAVEIEPIFAASYAANFGNHVFARSIEKLRKKDLPKADLVIGGPPCQGFSNLGKVTPTANHLKWNKLWHYYFKVVEWAKPRAFLIENVPEFLSSNEFKAAETRAKKLNYRIISGVLNAADFGVPQLRRRGFMLGVKKGVPRLPEPTTKRDDNTVRSVLGDLLNQPLVHDFSNGRMHEGKYISHELRELHIGRNPTAKSLERYKTIPPGGNRFTLMKLRPDLTPECWFRKKTGATDVMGRLEWDKPALTIRTEFFKPEKGKYLHPEKHRPITHWEAARIQTFPDDYKFCGSKTEIARQIGNAVPPKLAEAIAKEIKRILLGKQDPNRALPATPETCADLSCGDAHPCDGRCTE